MIRGSIEPPSLGRLHGHVLINDLTEDGREPPWWMRNGIAVYAAQSLLSHDIPWAYDVNRAGQLAFDKILTGELWALRAQEGVAIPPEFTERTNDEALRVLRRERIQSMENLTKLVHDSIERSTGPIGRETQMAVIEAVSQRMMRYFYLQFGPGAVVETLRRLGSGEGVDDALRATTGLSEAEFVSAWQEADAYNMTQLSPGQTDAGRRLARPAPRRPLPAAPANNRQTAIEKRQATRPGSIPPQTAVAP
jgi:hypothetical protein